MKTISSLASLCYLITSSLVGWCAAGYGQQHSFDPALVPGIAHPAYLDLDTGGSLAAYEYGNLKSNNLFVFIGGLFDGLFTLPYTPYLGNALDDWSSVQCLLTSSYSYWGFSSLSRDAYEISKCISYMAAYKKRQTGSVGKVVLMGSSTGANDIMWYLTRGTAKARKQEYPLNAVILQGPVSDQDYINWYAEENDLAALLEEGRQKAKAWIAAGKPDEPMPLQYEDAIYASPLTAYRYYSLSTYGGDDDFFSVNTSSAVRATTFGRINIPTLILWSGVDEYVPTYVCCNGSKVVEAFDRALPPKSRSKWSGVVPEALHAVPDEPGRSDLIRRIKGFLDDSFGRLGAGWEN